MQNGTKYHTKILTKRYPFSILDFGLERQKKKAKKPKSPHPMKNLVFWMELNTPMKILAFCISSFQISWHFTFCITWGITQPIHEGKIWVKLKYSRLHFRLCLVLHGIQNAKYQLL
jgi:hypothetical protein